MTLKQSRNLLSLLMTVVFVIGGCVFTCAMAGHYTLAHPKYISVHISRYAASQCRSNFEDRIAALEKRSGIPARVFAAELTDDMISEAIVSRLFSGDDTSLYTNSKIEQFENYIREYLDGNSVKYKEEYIRNTAVEAAKIYSECFGLKNSEAISETISKINSGYRQYASTALLIMVLSVAVQIILFGSIKKSFERVMSSITAYGMTVMLISVIGVVLRLGQHVGVLPAAYATVIHTMVRNVFILSLIGGFVVTAAGLVISSTLGTMISLQIERDKS